MSNLRQTIRWHSRRLSGLIRPTRWTLRFWGCNRRRKPNKHDREEEEEDACWFPTGVLLQIFARLPFRDIVRLRVLSKSWHARLHSIYLFELLLQHSSIDLSRCALALCYRPSKARLDRYRPRDILSRFVLAPTNILSRCVLALWYRPSKNRTDRYVPRHISLRLFFPPLRTWFHLPLCPALASKLGYGICNVRFNDQRRHIPANVWGSHAARGLMCSLISLDNKFGGQYFTIRSRHHRIVVFNYLTGKTIARIPFPPECLACMTSELRTFEPDFVLQISPDACCSEEYKIILADVAGAAPNDESSQSYQYAGIYSSKLGSWRSAKSVNSAIDVDSETQCFESADIFLFMEYSFILPYSVESDKWFRSNLGFGDEVSVRHHVFIWRGKVYLADALVEFDYTDWHDYEPPVEEVRGFRVCQLRTRNSGDGLYWHEISSTPAECLKGLRNMFKGSQYLYVSLENNGSVICMAVCDDPGSLYTPSPSPPMYSQHSSYAWTPILYDVESHIWSLLPYPKNEKKVLKLVHF